MAATTVNEKVSLLVEVVDIKVTRVRNSVEETVSCLLAAADLA